MQQRTLVLALVGLLATGTGLRQASGQEAQAGLKPGEVSRLAKLLTEWRTFPKYPSSDREEKKKNAARDAFLTEVDKIDKAHAEGNILAFTSSWSRVFKEVGTSELPKTPAGRGRILKEHVSQKAGSKQIGFDYALYVPRSYKSEDSWPLLIALHDKGSTGAKYLKEVWINPRRLDKSVADQFIIVAPTLGDKTVGRNPRHQMRIEWFDRLYRGGIAMCMIDVMSRYNVDTNRIYIEGTGRGGTTAIELSKMLTKWFAGVVSRNGMPNAKWDSAFPNFANQCPVWIVTRKGEDNIFAPAAGQVSLTVLEQFQKSKNVPLQIKEYDPLPDANAKRLAVGSQGADPVHDASKEIAEFFLGQTRQLFAPDLRYVTYDSRMFKQAPWFVLDRANAIPTDGTVAEVRGSVNREQNTIDFTTTNVESFRVYLNDTLIDLGRPVTIMVNGKEYLKKEVERSLDYMLQYNRDNPHDPSLVMVGDIRINVPVPDETDGGGGEAGAGTGGGK